MRLVKLIIPCQRYKFGQKNMISTGSILSGVTKIKKGPPAGWPLFYVCYLMLTANCCRDTLLCPLIVMNLQVPLIWS